MNIDNLSDSFTKSIQNKLNDLNIDYSEILLDSVTESEVIKEIPIVKTLVSFAKMGITIKNQFLVKKIVKFLLELDSSNVKERLDFVEKLEKNGNRKRILDNLLIIIDRLDNDEKAQIIGKLFKSYILNKIDKDVFFRLANIVEKVYIYDLLALNDRYNNKLNEDNKIDNLYILDKTVATNLASYGLMYAIFGDNNYERKILDSSKIEISIKEYKISRLGESLIEYGF